MKNSSYLVLYLIFPLIVGGTITCMEKIAKRIRGLWSYISRMSTTFLITGMFFLFDRELIIKDSTNIATAVEG